MKICDMCKRGDGEPLSDESVHTVTIGTSIMTVKAGEQEKPFPKEIELCGGCIKRVNESIAEYLEERFGLKIKWLS